MKNNSNIYDVDGELIRAISDTHEMTVEEAQERAEYYRKKLEEIGDNDPKAVVYSTYIRNLSMYIFNLYSKHPELLTEALQKRKTTNEQIKEAIDELKTEIESQDEGSPRAIRQEDLLVSGEGRPETVMDSYAQFEELPVSDETSKQFEEV